MTFNHKNIGSIPISPTIFYSEIENNKIDMLELENRTVLGAVGKTLVGSSPTIYIAREYIR